MKKKLALQIMAHLWNMMVCMCLIQNIDLYLVVSSIAIFKNIHPHMRVIALDKYDELISLLL